MNRSDLESLGFGLGLRRCRYAQILDEHPPTDWFEVISENFMVAGGRPLQVLEGVRSRYPNRDAWSFAFDWFDGSAESCLSEQLAATARRFEPAWISDHYVGPVLVGRNLHDLMPLPYTDEVVRRVAGRIRQVQEILEQTILIENVSSYMEFTCSRLSEWEFLSAVADEADCAILLDINNIFVSA